MRRLPRRGRVLGAFLVLLAAIPPALADVAPEPGPNRRAPRPACARVLQVDSVVVAKLPRPAIAATGRVSSARQAIMSLQFRGVTGAGTNRATAVFDWMACGDPRVAGRSVEARVRTDMPRDAVPQGLRYVTVRAVNNAVTVRY